MDLILWRHAEAEDARAGESDLDRVLTAKGEQQAARMAEWLNARLPAPVRIVASPARRTQQTAQVLGRPFETVVAIAPGAPARAVLDAARWPGAAAAVLVVGHQPTLGHVAAQLLAGRPAGLPIRKAGVWWFRSRGDGEAVLQVALAPDWL